MEKRANNKIWAYEYGLQQEQKTASPLCNKYNQFQKELPHQTFKEPMLMSYASSILQTSQQDSKLNQQVVYEVSDVIYPHSKDIEIYNQLIKENVIKQNAKTSNQKYYFRQNKQKKLERMIKILLQLQQRSIIQNQLTFLKALRFNFKFNNNIKQTFYQKNVQFPSKTSFFNNPYNEYDSRQQMRQHKKLNENVKKYLQQLSGLLVFKILMIQSQAFSTIRSYKPVSSIYEYKNIKNVCKSIKKVNDSRSSTVSDKTSNANILQTIHFLKQKSKVRQQIQQNSHTPIKIQEYEDIYSTPHTKKNIYFNETMKKKKKQLSQTQTMNSKKNSEIISQCEYNSLHTCQKYQEKQLWEQNQLPTIKNIHRVSLQNNIIKIQPTILQPNQQKRRYLIIRTNLFEFHLNANLKQSKFISKENSNKLYKQSHDMFTEAQVDIKHDFKPVELKNQVFQRKKQTQKYSNKVIQYQSDYRPLQKTQKKQKQKIEKYYFQQKKQYPYTEKKKQIVQPIIQRQSQKKIIENKYEQYNKQKERLEFSNQNCQETRKSKLFTGKKYPNLKKDSFFQVHRNDSKISNKSSERKVNSMPKVIFNTLRPNHFSKQASLLKPNIEIHSQIKNMKDPRNFQYRINQFQLGKNNLPLNSKDITPHYFSQKNLSQQRYFHHESKLNTQNHTPQKIMIKRDLHNIQIGPSSPKVQYYSRPLSPNQNNLINKYFDDKQNYNYSTLPPNNKLLTTQKGIFTSSSNKSLKSNQIKMKYGQQFSTDPLNNINRNKIMSQIPRNNLFSVNDSQLSRPDSNLISLQSKNSQISQTKNQQFFKNPMISRPKSMSAKIFVTLRNQKKG